MMVINPNFSKALAKACSEDGYLQHALDAFLSDARMATAETASAFLAHFARQRLEQEKDNSIHFQKSGEALREGLALAQKLALLNTVEGYNLKRVSWIVEIMLAICDMVDWVTQGKIEQRFKADLSVGDTTAIMGLLYEQVAPHCTEKQKERLAKAIFEKGILPICDEWLSPYKHRHALDTMGHNWWLVIICGAGIAAMAIRDMLPEYETYLAAVLEGCRGWFDYPGNVLQNKKGNFGPDGDFIEFIGYLTYGLSNYAIMEDMHRSLYGQSELFEKEKLQRLADYYLVHYYEIDGEVYGANFGDTSKQQEKHQHAVYYLMQRFSRGDFFHQHKKLSKGPNQWMDFAFYPAVHGLKENPKVTAPLFSLYRHAGYAVMRDGFGPKDTFFAMKTGESWNHNHLDVGTFILSTGGKELAVDSGTCDYGRPEYKQYYVTPQAHNVVLFDGQGEDSDAFHSGTKFPGGFPASLNVKDRGFRYLLADCCGPYGNIYPRFYRHVLFLQGLLIFIDDMQTYRDGELSWLMHYNGDLSPAGNAWRLDADGVEATLHPLYPPNQTFRTGDAWRSEIRQGVEKGLLPRSHFLSLNSKTVNCRAKLIQAIQLPGAELSLHMETDGTIICITIDRDESIEKVYINTRADGSFMHKNSHADFESVSTDAFLVYTKASTGEYTDIAIINGSWLSLDEKPVVGAMVKLDAHLCMATQAYHATVPMDAAIHIAGAATLQLKKGENCGRWQDGLGR